MPFQPGQSGNPSGRPPGSRNKVNRAMDPVFTANGEAVIERLVEHAKAANPVAMRLCLERLVPMGKHRPVGFQLPPMKKGDDVHAAIAAIHDALGDGDISTGEATDLLRVAELTARILREADQPKELAARLARVEAALARYGETLGIDDLLLAPRQRTDAPPAAAEAEPIANNNAETMAADVAAPVEPRATPATEADAAPKTEASIVNNNAETMDAADKPPPPEFVSNNENTPESSDAPAVEPLRVASG